MFRWQTWVGVTLGLALGFSILNLAGGRSSNSPRSGPILSECDGHWRELVIHYEPDAKAIAVPVYREFLRALEPDVRVRVVCPNPTAFEELVALVGRVRCQLAPVMVNHPMTTWSRDRWVALSPASHGAPTTLWSPRGEAAEEIWPARAGDERIGLDLAAALGPAVLARRSPLYFDGGDFLADSENVFVVPRVLPRNLQHTVRSQAELLRILADTFKRRVRLLEEPPDHHAGMFMVSAGHKVMLVGDPNLGKHWFSLDQANAGATAAADFMNLPEGPDFSPETQHRFDAVATQCSEAGYQVVRIPLVPARDGRTYLTYVNVLLDQQGSHRIVYLPFYRGVESLNAAARAIWERLGCEVRPVDCTSAYVHFGCLHCLVNVLTRA